PLYVGVLHSTLIRLFFLRHGNAWALLSMTLAWFGDTGAYFVGRFFGKTKLFPMISPSKTRAGVWGGLAGSTLAAYLMHSWLLPTLSLREACVIGPVIGALGQLGDLAE